MDMREGFTQTLAIETELFRIELIIADIVTQSRLTTIKRYARETNILLRLKSLSVSKGHTSLLTLIGRKSLPILYLKQPLLYNLSISPKLTHLFHYKLTHPEASQQGIFNVNFYSVFYEGCLL